MSLLITVLSASALLCAILLVLVNGLNKQRHLPPGPPGWPIIGHLPILQAPLHQCLHQLAQRYGPLLFIKLGSTPTVVASSPLWAKEFLHTHDSAFADRPQFEASKRLFYGNGSMVMMEYGSTWRELKKLYTVQILTAKRVEMFGHLRREEMAVTMEVIRKSQHKVVNLRNLVFNTVGNMMSRMLFSERSFDAGEATDGRESEFKRIVAEMSVLFGTPVIGDLIPWLSWLDIKGYKKQMDRLAKRIDVFLEDVLVRRMAGRSKGGQYSEDRNSEASDYLDLLLQIYSQDGKVDKKSIKSILLDLLAAGAETTTTAIEWSVAELLRSPDCMSKLQAELDHAMPPTSHEVSGIFQCADLTKLSYLQAVIKESLRLHPPVSLHIRRMCKSLETGTQVGPYNLPKKSRVLVNLWSMSRDATLWGESAYSFCPDRFLHNSTPDYHGQHFEFLPFGTGRRMCPGINLALASMSSIMANLIWGFHWKVPDDMPLDLSEASALTTPMAKPLLAIPILRQWHL